MFKFLSDFISGGLLAAVVVMVLWAYVVSSLPGRSGTDYFYNVYINIMRGWAEKPVGRIMSLFQGRLGASGAAALVIAAVLILQTLISGAGSAGQRISFGGVHYLKCGKDVFLLNSFVFASASVILYWAQISLLAIWLRRRLVSSGRDTVNLFSALSWPASGFSETRAAFLSVLAVVLSVTAAYTSSGMGFVLGEWFAYILLAFVDVLEIVSNMLLCAVVFSVFAVFSGCISAGGMASSFADALTASFMKTRFRFGFFDFTPVILLFLLGFVHDILVRIIA